MPQAIGAIASIGGAVLGSKSAGKAADAQRGAAVQQMNLERETRDLIRGDLSQYRQGGGVAQAALDYELGLGPRPMIGGNAAAIETFTPGQGWSGGGAMQTPSYGPNSLPGMGGQPQGGGRNMPGPRGAGLARPGGMSGMSGILFDSIVGNRPGQNGGGGGAGGGGQRFRVNGQEFGTMEDAQAFANANRTGGTEYGGFTATPGYDFRLQQGQDSLQASAAARGGLNSGAAMRDLLKFGQDYGSNEYGNFLARLGARADTGFSAAQMSGQATGQAAAGMSNALGNAGNAAAAGAIGRGNALTGGLQNLAGVWNYQQNMNNNGGGRFTMADAADMYDW